MRFRSAAALSLLLAACGQNATVSSNQLRTDDNEIIGGFESSGKSLESIGSLGINYEGQYYMMCTATLIGPKTVLTAKHCVTFLDDGWTPAEYVGQPLAYFYQLQFATGNGNNPTKTYDAVWSSQSGINEGGLVGLGNDVAVLHLKEAVTDLTPVPFYKSPEFSQDLLGTKGTIIGYGSQNNVEDATGQLSGTRKQGNMTFGAFGGKFYELALGSYEGFLNLLNEQYGADAVAECVADPSCNEMIQGWYNDTVLLDGYELWMAKKAGDAITCHGDSGGPLLKKLPDENGVVTRQVLGVVSGGMGSSELACDYGSVYATFGLDTQSFLEKSLSWEDPCAGESFAGSCNGTVASRCSFIFEGPRALLKTDCADLDQVCGTNADGQAVCLDPQEPAPSERFGAFKASLQSPQNLRLSQFKVTHKKVSDSVKRLK